MNILDKMKAACEMAKKAALVKLDEEYQIKFALINKNKNPDAAMKALKTCISDYENAVKEINNDFVPSKW